MIITKIIIIKNYRTIIHQSTKCVKHKTSLMKAIYETLPQQAQFYHKAGQWVSMPQRSCFCQIAVNSNLGALKNYFLFFFL